MTPEQVQMDQQTVQKVGMGIILVMSISLCHGLDKCSEN